MNQVHFQAFADAIVKIEDTEERFAVSILVGEVCESFNNRFNWEKFRVATRTNNTWEYYQQEGR